MIADRGAWLRRVSGLSPRVDSEARLLGMIGVGLAKGVRNIGVYAGLRCCRTIVFVAVLRLALAVVTLDKRYSALEHASAVLLHK